MALKMVKLSIPMQEEKAQEPPILPRIIQTMIWAYDEICAGEDPQTALGNFTNAWYRYAKHMRADLVCEPLRKPEQETENRLFQNKYEMYGWTMEAIAKGITDPN